MLGHNLTDPHGVEGAAEGPQLLPLSTEFQTPKRYHRGTYTFAKLTGFWAPLSDLGFEAYEIRHGRTRSIDADPNVSRPRHSAR